MYYVPPLIHILVRVDHLYHTQSSSKSWHSFRTSPLRLPSSKYSGTFWEIDFRQVWWRRDKVLLDSFTRNPKSKQIRLNTYTKHRSEQIWLIYVGGSLTAQQNLHRKQSTRHLFIQSCMYSPKWFISPSFSFQIISNQTIELLQFVTKNTFIMCVAIQQWDTRNISV